MFLADQTGVLEDDGGIDNSAANIRAVESLSRNMLDVLTVVRVWRSDVAVGATVSERRGDGLIMDVVSSICRHNDYRYWNAGGWLRECDKESVLVKKYKRMRATFVRKSEAQVKLQVNSTPCLRNPIASPGRVLGA